MKSCKPETAPDYRRGYYQGYCQAIEDLKARLKSQTEKFAWASTEIEEHMSKLKDWQAGVVATPPPTVESSSSPELK